MDKGKCVFQNTKDQFPNRERERDTSYFRMEYIPGDNIKLFLFIPVHYSCIMRFKPLCIGFIKCHMTSFLDIKNEVKQGGVSRLEFLNKCFNFLNTC